MQIWAEFGKSALPICNYSQILYQFLTFTQNLKRSRKFSVYLFPSPPTPQDRKKRATLADGSEINHLLSQA